MNFLGIDFGTKRIGLSFGDRNLKIALPLDPIIYPDPRVQFHELALIVQERQIDAFVVGYPLLEGEKRAITQKVDQFIERLKDRFSLPVFYIDETLTSFQVECDQEQYRKQPKFKEIKKTRQQGKQDSQAATLILQDFFSSCELDLLPASSGAVYAK